jgi:hypothetical protein
MPVPNYDRPLQSGVKMSTESTSSDRLQQVGDSKDLSQLVRSNTVHYWTTMKNHVDLSRLKPYLGYEGMMAGDPHAGNFAVLPLRAVDGSRKMRYVNVDFDDAGHGPFVLDFIRFVIASKATDSEIKRRPQEKAYIKGLSGKELVPPKKVRELLDLPVSQYDAMATDYLRKRSSNKGFTFKDGEIEPYTAKIDRASIERVLPKVKVIDIGIRPLERGGSAGELRIWVLVEGADARRRIMELKQYEEPATAKYQPQPPPQQRLKEIRLAFWSGLDGSDYDLVGLRGGGLFWIREKRVSLIDIPYSSKEAKKLDFLDELEIYDANQLGLAHSRQSGAHRYHAAIKADPETFHQATERVEKAYLDIAKKAFAAK